MKLKIYNIKRVKLDDLESIAYEIISSAEKTYKIKENSKKVLTKLKVV